MSETPKSPARPIEWNVPQPDPAPSMAPPAPLPPSPIIPNPSIRVDDSPNG